MKHRTGDLRLYYRIIVSDENGRVTKRTRWRVCRSYVQQWIQGHRPFFTSTAEGNVRDTGNVLRTLDDPSVGAQIFGDLTQSAGAIDATGLAIGTDGTAVGIADFNLLAQIADGAGGGQMEYQTTGIGAITVVGDVASMIVSRAFINVSGGAITVAEFAAICHGERAGGGDDFFLIAREVPSPAVVVNDLATITIQTTVRISV